MHPYLERDMNNSGAKPLPMLGREDLDLVRRYHTGQISLNYLRATLGLPPWEEMVIPEIKIPVWYGDGTVEYKTSDEIRRMGICRIVSVEELGGTSRDLPDSWLRKLAKKIIPIWKF